MDIRVGLKGCGKFAPTGIRSLDCPARIESLYELTTEQENTGNTNCIMRRFIARRKLCMESLKGKDHLESVYVHGRTI